MVVLVVAVVGGTSSSQGDTHATVSSTQSALRLAQSVVNHYASFPKTIPVTARHKKAIPKGKSIVYITCGVQTCEDIAKTIGAGAKVLGWKFTKIESTGAPESVKAAFDTAVRQKPTAVLASGFNKAEFAPELAALNKAHIGVFECCNTDGVGGGIKLNLSGLVDQGQQGQAQAAWAAVQTKGKANVLFINLPDYTIEAGVKKAFVADLPKYCPGCPVASIDIALSGIPNAPNTIVSYLRAHPKVNWVALDQDALAPGLPAALKAAGLANKVHFSGQGATSVNYQYIQSGQQSASVEFPLYELWWTEIDAIARSINGESLGPDQIATPFHLVTKANLRDTTGTKPITPNLVAQFKKLWGR